MAISPPIHTAEINTVFFWQGIVCNVWVRDYLVWRAGENGCKCAGRCKPSSVVWQMIGVLQFRGVHSIIHYNTYVTLLLNCAALISGRG